MNPTSPSKSLPSGVRLGPYTVTALIGAGGMGQVYQAIDTRLNRKVAIKVLPEHFASDSTLRQRFEREAKAISSLNHPNICTLFDVGTQDGVEFVVMEYLEGETLAERLARGRLPFADALHYAIQMTDALEAAHERGIIHRDFKPANVVLTAHGAVKLLDFGIAKILEGDVAEPAPALTVVRGSQGPVLGTPDYMSPEQAQGSFVDRRTDIWAFGCVLFEMLTGRRSSAHETLAEVTSTALERELSFADLPLAARPAIFRLLRRCLDRDPKRRMHDIGDGRIELEDALKAIGTPGTADRRPSIAVLPFVNMSPDPENEYFSDGLAEEILNALAQIPGLKVIARTSAFAFKGKQDDVRRIAEVLDVNSVLEGSVRKAGTRVRVTAQLIAAADGSHLWSKRYDRELSDVFTVQDDIAGAIADALRVTLSVRREERKPTSNSAAYEAFLKAGYYFGKSTAEGFRRSQELLEQAVVLDPQFALAYCALGNGLFVAYTGQLIPAHDAVPRIRGYVERALSLDPTLAEGHNMMACLAAMYDYDWTEADRRHRLSYASGPVGMDVRWRSANFFLAHAGRAREAAEDLARARAEDPLNPIILWTLAVSLRALGKDVDADAFYKEVVDMDAGFISSIAAVVLSGNHLARGAITEAIGFAETAYQHHPKLPYTIGQLSGALARAGELERSEGLANQLRPGTAFGAPFGLALAALGAGDLDATADWLEKAIEQRDPWVSFLLNVGNIGGRVMWTSPRWPALAKLLNVPVARELPR